MQKEVQKDNHDWRHQAKLLPELQPGQVLFLNLADNKSKYIQGTILSPSSTPRSHKIEANDKIYHGTQLDICTINVITPFTRPCATQCQKSNKQCKDSLTRPSVPPKSVCNSLTRPPLPHTPKAHSHYRTINNKHYSTKKPHYKTIVITSAIRWWITVLPHKCQQPSHSTTSSSFSKYTFNSQYTNTISFT